MFNRKPRALLLQSGKFAGLKEKIRRDYSGFQFCECEEGYKAIDLINKSRDEGKEFDMIVLDFPESDCSRFELFTHLKNVEYQSRLMMITGMNGKVHLEPFSLSSDFNELVKRYQCCLNLDQLTDVLMGIQVRK